MSHSESPSTLGHPHHAQPFAQAQRARCARFSLRHRDNVASGIGCEISHAERGRLTDAAEVRLP
jgi:hypothetical protein